MEAVTSITDIPKGDLLHLPISQRKGLLHTALMEFQTGLLGNDLSYIDGKILTPEVIFNGGGVLLAQRFVDNGIELPSQEFLEQFGIKALWIYGWDNGETEANQPQTDLFYVGFLPHGWMMKFREANQYTVWQIENQKGDAQFLQYWPIQENSPKPFLQRSVTKSG